MGGKLVPKVILEGTRLTHKTDLAFALNEHPRVVGPRRYRYPSPLVSAEWCAFTNVPWGRGLVNFAPEEEALAMETYATWARLFELQRYYSWIVDRFHVSTRVHQLRARGKDYAFGWLEDRLRPLGFAVTVKTDVGRAGFVRCLPNGCVAEVVMDDNLLKQLRGGQTATFIIFQTPEEGIGFPMSLKGFGEGYDQLP